MNGAVVARLRERIATDLEGLRGAASAIDSQTVPDEYATIFTYQRATLDYGIRAHELAAQWLEALPHAAQ